jgi:hypothetical protein
VSAYVSVHVNVSVGVSVLASVGGLLLLADGEVLLFVFFRVWGCFRSAKHPRSPGAFGPVRTISVTPRTVWALCAVIFESLSNGKMKVFQDIDEPFVPPPGKRWYAKARLQITLLVVFEWAAALEPTYYTYASHCLEQSQAFVISVVADLRTRLRAERYNRHCMFCDMAGWAIGFHCQTNIKWTTWSTPSFQRATARGIATPTAATSRKRSRGRQRRVS